MSHKQTVKPTITYRSTDSKDVLTVWPAIPGVSPRPVIQIDHGKARHTVVEFAKADAPGLAAAILKAAEESA